MNNPHRILGAVLGTAILLSAPALAQRQDQRLGNLGNVNILSVTEGGRFDRCYGHLPGIGGGARVFWNIGRDFVLTVPAVGVGEALLVTIMTPRGYIEARGSLTGGRTVAPLNAQQAQQMRALRGSFEVDVNGTRFPYSLQGVTMEDVFQAIEECAHAHNR